MHGHNSACAIVGPKKVRGLHKIGFLCNCCPIFKATIARLSFEAEVVCNFPYKKRRKLHTGLKGPARKKPPLIEAVFDFRN